MDLQKNSFRSKREHVLKKIKDFILRNRNELIIFSSYLLFLIILRNIVPIWPLYLRDFAVDSEYYYMMGEDITSIFKREIIAPFCYRVLHPFIAMILPFDLYFSFALISFSCLYLTGIMLYYTLRTECDEVVSLIGLILFCVYFSIINNQFIIFNLAIPYLVDSMAFFFVIFCFFCILNSYDKLYCVSLILGVLSKEVVIFTIPVFLFHSYGENKERFINSKEKLFGFFRLFKYIIPSVATFLIIRIFVVPKPISETPPWISFYHGNEYSIDLLFMYIQYRIERLSIFMLFELTFGVWNFLLVLAFFNRKDRITNWIKLYSIFMILVYCQIFMTYNSNRVILVGIYPMIMLSSTGLYTLLKKPFKKKIHGISDS
jgi:hypothetical protein